MAKIHYHVIIQVYSLQHLNLMMEVGTSLQIYHPISLRLEQTFDNEMISNCESCAALFARSDVRRNHTLLFFPLKIISVREIYSDSLFK